MDSNTLTLDITHSHLIGEWDDEKSISDFKAGSRYKAKWKCIKEHRWEAIISSRALKGSRCPYCTNRKVFKGFNDLATTHPHLIEEWADERSIETVTAGGTLKVRWKCDKEHVYHKEINKRAIKNHGCPFCSNRKLLKGFNDMETIAPHLSLEWNDEIPANEVMATSTKKGKWKCQINPNHQWENSPSSRLYNSSGCPFCSGLKATKGVNDITVTHPYLIREWSDERDIRTVSAGSKFEAKWKCQKEGHIYKLSVYKKATKKQDCVYCSNSKVLIGFNDLKTNHPELIEEWDDERDMTEFTPGSSKKVKWKCSEYSDHKWEMKISVRTGKKKFGCPICKGKMVKPGFNDLATTHSQLAEEWDDEKDIRTVSAGMNYRAKWKCKKGHKWSTNINNRTRVSLPTICPNCAFGNASSKNEKEIHSYLESILPKEIKIEKSYRNLIPPYELDIYIPDKNIAIEYNGLYWHSEKAGKDKWYHYNKWNECKDKGVQLIQIWEDDYLKNPKLVHKVLEHKLGISKAEIVPARKTYFGRINKTEAEDFLTENHLQGFHGSSTYYGLKDKKTNELVSVMSTRYHSSNNSIEISRFATSKIVQGGFSKLLANVIKNENRTINKIISYSHNDHSLGELYRKNGFQKKHEGTPGYFYIRNNQREHRLNYSAKRFKERTDLIYEEGKSERELADLNTLNRVWDSGSSLWEKTVKA